MASVTAALFQGHKKPMMVSILKKSTLNQPKDGEIYAKIVYASICGSDLHTLEGKRTQAAPWLVTGCIYRSVLSL